MTLGNYEHADISSLRYEQPTLSNEGYEFSPKKVFYPKIEREHPTYYDMFQPFNKRKYLFPRHPIDMGKIDMTIFDGVPNVLRMIIKMKYGPVRIPKELAPLNGLIERLIGYENSISPAFSVFFVHVTVDTSTVEKDLYHRFPGYHGDGFQGSKFPKKNICEHSYIVVSDPGTEICLQPFFLDHLDDAKHNVFTEMDKQARQENVYTSLPDHLYLFDPYVVHRSPLLKKPTKRTFFRLTVTPEELLVPKNTVNPMFTGQEYLDRIDIRSLFSEDCDMEVPYRMYGLERK